MRNKKTSDITTDSLGRVVNWPDWKDAPAGTRVEEVNTGRRGTFVKRSPVKNNGAIVDWDDVGFGVSRGNVISACYDLRPVEGEG